MTSRKKRGHRRLDNISLLLAGYAGTFLHMTPTLCFRVMHERNILLSMEMSFFALPSQQGPVQGRFKPAHDSAAFDKLRPRASRGELVAGRPISLSTKVPACVRRFEMPTALNHGRPALALSFGSCVWIRGYFTSLLSLLMPYEPGLGQGQSQKKTPPCSFLQ
jgi:hypothetical protein